LTETNKSASTNLTVMVNISPSDLYDSNIPVKISRKSLYALDRLLEESTSRLNNLGKDRGADTRAESDSPTSERIASNAADGFSDVESSSDPIA
jgi:hypothetical protein